MMFEAAQSVRTTDVRRDMFRFLQRASDWVLVQ